MNTDLPKAFLHRVEKIRDKTARDKVNQAIKAVKKAESIKEIPHLRKVEDGKGGISYRIRVGDYRIGIRIENNLVVFVDVGPRDKFYNTFPTILFI